MHPEAEPTNDLIQWNAFREGSESAFGNLYTSHYRLLRNYGRRFGADDATVEDAIHDLFIELWNYRRTLARPDSVRSYILRSFRNRLVAQLTERQRHVAPEQVENRFGLLPAEPSVEERLIEAGLNQEQHRQVRTALLGLSPRQQEILYLRYFSDLDYDQICAVMGITYNTARTQLHQALVALRKRLQPHWPVLVWVLLAW
ncbi:RNA polymerase sigma factor [Larkinella soli]|uniref:RNA polymerase sigma factor n=1 Tax=Larkinella soli TaxID=1770527 RepID=UPI000FFB50BC|nr:sigma-70 family RNA polymerase sigma factor [Larkinella soli]